jgi:hypothetical protein
VNSVKSFLKWYLKIKKIKTHHIADLFAIKEGAAKLTGIYDAVTLSA